MKILRSVYQELIDHALSESPDECCGFLGAQDGMFRAWLPVDNLAEDREHHYKIGQSAQFTAQRKLLRHDCDFIAVYHSHPRGRAEPSTTDAKYAFALLQVIVTPQEIRAWHVLEGDWRPVELEIVAG